MNPFVSLVKKAVRKRSTYSPMVVDEQDFSKVRFCFTGEFGYELVSWIPYLLFLKKTLDMPIRTIGRPGSKVFYYFSDDHLEALSTDISYVWGDPKKYDLLKKRFSGEKLIYPQGFDMTCKQDITVAGFSWNNKNIHQTISKKNYLCPKYSNIKMSLPFETKRPIVVINNKYTKESGLPPTNFYDRNSLILLRNLLVRNGFFVFYNRFIEETAVDENGRLRDEDIFAVKQTFDMRNYYKKVSDQTERNLTQVSLFNKSNFVVAVQGGNAYLPAICGKDIFLLMRMGVYLDYQELSRLYKFNLESFYEPKHLIFFLENYLKSHPVKD